MSRRGSFRKYQREARAYLMLFLSAVLLLNLPSGCTRTVKSCAYVSVTPLTWISRSIKSAANSTIAMPLASIWPSARKKVQKDRERALSLEAANTQLKGQVEQLLYLLREHNDASHAPRLDPAPASARVVLRPPDEWLKTFWIDLGESDNIRLGYNAVSPHSPVLVGSKLIGVVDLVEARKSRVRLLTDSGMVAAVRVARGQPQNVELIDHIDHVVDALHFREDLPHFPEREVLTESLESLHSRISPDSQAWRLAKGELHGTGRRQRDGRPLLAGRGFNCDWEDDHTPARDLRSGKPREGEGEAVTLIQKGDLLVTSGLDGLFPPDLHVGTVTHVHPLKEGASSYALEAVPCCAELDQLQLVSVLPAIDGPGTP